MGYTPNNPLVPGDPYSYDLRWIVEQIKSAGNVKKYAEEAAISAETAETAAEEAIAAAGSITNADYFATPEQYGAVGDSVTDDTAAIQAAFDSGKPVIIFKKNATYKVSKANDLVIFPNNDEPCVYLANKSNITIIGNNATLKSDIHGQGVMEIFASSNIIVDALKFSGYGSFPAIAPDGRGEKGDASGGYYTAGYDWESHKNNSVDTSAFLGVNGDATQPWGTFGGGFIGNAACGLLIENGCENIYISNCISTGFNYSGFSVGFRGHSGYAVNKNIIFEKCIANNMYDDGFNILLCDGVTISHCLIENIGHPSARLNDTSTPYSYTYADPGYGITCRKPIDVYSQAQNVNIVGNTINNCVRKGIDSHGCNGWSVDSNNVYLCYVGGINIAGGSTDETSTFRAQIINNIIRYCGLGGEAVSSSHATDGANTPQNKNITLNISNNILENCATANQGFIYVRTSADTIISNNIIRDFWSLFAITTSQVIYVGNGDKQSELVTIANNIITISATFQYVIRLLNVNNGSIHDNIAHVTKVANAVAATGAIANNVNICNNRIIADTATGSPALSGSTGAIINNIMSGSDGMNLSFIRNTYDMTGGVISISNPMFRSNSRVFIQKLYSSASSQLDLIFTAQPSAGSCNIYVRDHTGATAADGKIYIAIMVYNYE